MKWTRDGDQYIAKGKCGARYTITVWTLRAPLQRTYVTTRDREQSLGDVTRLADAKVKARDDDNSRLADAKVKARDDDNSRCGR